MRFFLFSVLFAVSFSAEAKVLRGDWESSGDLPAAAPVESVPFRYSCQAELTDGHWRNRGAAERSQRLFAVAKFELSKERQWLKSSDLNWSWLWLAQLDGKEETEYREFPLERSPKEAFSVAHHSFSMQVVAGKDGPFQGVLRANLSLPLGGFLVSQFRTVPFLVSDDSVVLNAELSQIANLPGRNQLEPRLELYLVCEKAK